MCVRACLYASMCVCSYCVQASCVHVRVYGVRMCMRARARVCVSTCVRARLRICMLTCMRTRVSIPFRNILKIVLNSRKIDRAHTHSCVDACMCAQHSRVCTYSHKCIAFSSPPYLTSLPPIPPSFPPPPPPLSLSLSLSLISLLHCSLEAL